jgi:nucleoside-diphosphate-sugar epimerase
MPKYLVTGGAGFIGSSIVEKLVNMGCNVSVVDNFSTGRFENIKGFIDKIEFFCGDLADFGVAQRVVEGVDYILHQAAIPSVPFSVIDPLSSNRSMVTATVNLFKAAVEAKTVKRIVQATSSAAYGDNPEFPKKEDMSAEPQSPYAVAKIAQEYYAKVFNKIYGLEVLSLRYFNVFGPRQCPESLYSAVIAKFISMILQGKCPVIYGDGKQSRDFVYIENVVEANLKACHCEWTGNSEIINIGCGKSTTLNELLEMINSIMKTNVQAVYEYPRKGDIEHSLADISKAKKILGYEVKVDIYNGLVELIDWYAKNHMAKS